MKKYKSEIKNTLSVIRYIGEIIAENTSRDKMLELVTAHLCQYLNADVCSIYVYDNVRKALVMAATYGFPQDVIGKIILKAEQGITGKVFCSGNLVNTISSDSEIEQHYFSELKEEDLKSILSVPLKVGEEMVGVLNIESKESTLFSHKEVSLLKTIAPQVANILLDFEIFNKINTEKENYEFKVSAKNLKLSGQAVCNGVATGHCLKMDTNSLLNSIYWRKIKDTKSELILFEQALVYAKEETLSLEKAAAKILTESDASIFYSHLLIMEDKHLIDNVRSVIESGTTVKFALKTVLLELRKEFMKIDSESIRERIVDITDVVLRIIQGVNSVLLKNKSNRADKKLLPFDGDDKLIIIAHELFPSQLISWPLHKMAGIICETGGLTSHVAIIAKALKIPTLMGVEKATSLIKQNDNILLDCEAGNCYINPDEELLNTFKEVLKPHETEPQSSDFALDIRQKTVDGKKVNLYANMSLVSELPLLQQYGATGIGLYRTEFLFMVRSTAPTVEDQIKVFTTFAKKCKKGRFTIRLLDVGGDKPVSYLNFDEETNPLLGIRGIRLLLKYRVLLNTHIDAILQTSFVAPVNILIPMITTVDELILIKNIIQERKMILEHQLGKKITDYKIGFMVETPSIIWELDKALAHVDFISIGSNDLVQYSFAVDRNNSSAIGNFKSTNPATIKMLKSIADTMKKYPHKKVTLCGEIAGDPQSLPLLLGIGLHNFSMSPWLIPGIREITKQVSLSECKELADGYMAAKNQKDADKLLADFRKQFND